MPPPLQGSRRDRTQPWRSGRSRRSRRRAHRGRRQTATLCLRVPPSRPSPTPPARTHLGLVVARLLHEDELGAAVEVPVLVVVPVLPELLVPVHLPLEPLQVRVVGDLGLLLGGLDLLQRGDVLGDPARERRGRVSGVVEGCEGGASGPGCCAALPALGLHWVPEPHAALLDHQPGRQTQLPG